MGWSGSNRLSWYEVADSQPAALQVLLAKGRAGAPLRPAESIVPLLRRLKSGNGADGGGRDSSKERQKDVEMHVLKCSLLSKRCQNDEKKGLSVKNSCLAASWECFFKVK